MTFDIILVHTLSRVHSFYLNIIHTLSFDFSIAIYVSRTEVHKKARKKLDQTESTFLETCMKLGASIVKKGEKHACKLLFVPQDNGDPLENITYSEVIGLHRFGSGQYGLKELKKLGVNEFWTLEKKLFTGQLEYEGKSSLANEFDILEMGAPYKKYPAFDFSSLAMDYILAYPSPMLISEPPVKLSLLKNIYSLLRSIPEKKRVIIKLHNVFDGGFKMSRGRVLGKIGKTPAKGVDLLSILLTSGTLGNIPLLSEFFAKVRVDIIGSLIEEKAISLSELSNYSNFGIEHFLPFVKEGLITGLSGTIWHALYNRNPVYNCDDRLPWSDMPNYSSYKLFAIPPCHGKREFNPINYQLISEESRKADIIEMMKRRL